MSHANRQIRSLVRLLHLGCGVLLLLVAAGVGVFVILPAYQKADQTQLSSEEYLRELDLITKVKTSNDAINRQMERYREDLTRFEAQLPSSAKMDDFLRGFAALAAGCDVRIDDIRPKPMSQGQIYWQMPILVRAEAKFMDYFRFLAKLQKYARITRIQRVDIGAETSKEPCSFEMTLLIYATGPGRSVADASR